MKKKLLVVFTGQNRFIEQTLKINNKSFSQLLSKINDSYQIDILVTTWFEKNIDVKKLANIWTHGNIIVQQKSYNEVLQSFFPDQSIEWIQGYNGVKALISKAHGIIQAGEIVENYHSVILTRSDFIFYFNEGSQMHIFENHNLVNSIWVSDLKYESKNNNLIWRIEDNVVVICSNIIKKSQQDIQHIIYNFVDEIKTLVLSNTNTQYSNGHGNMVVFCQKLIELCPNNTRLVTASFYHQGLVFRNGFDETEILENLHDSKYRDQLTHKSAINK